MWAAARETQGHMIFSVEPLINEIPPPETHRCSQVDRKQKSNVKKDAHVIVRVLYVLAKFHWKKDMFCTLL